MRFRDHFATPRVLLPVIHVLDVDQACDNSEIAFANGAGGIFLIAHGSMSHRELVSVYEAVRKQHPYGWIGLNFLDLSPVDAASALPPRANGLWTDNGGFDPLPGSHAEAWQTSAQLQKSTENSLWFAGFAFKGQRQPKDLERVAAEAWMAAGVLTTSGPGTGQSADLEKIARIRSAIGLAPLAIASGITPENVQSYRPYVNAYLVATGISQDFHTLDGHKVREVATALRGQDPVTGVPN